MSVIWLHGLKLMSLFRYLAVRFLHIIGLLKIKITMKKKVVSFGQSLVEKDSFVSPCEFDVEQIQFVNDKAEFEGKVITKGIFKSIKPSQNFDGYRVSDFSLENMIEAGVELSPVKVIGDNFSVCEDIERALAVRENNKIE